MTNWVDEFRALTDESNDIEPESSKGHKLDLFKEVLPALDRRDKKYYSNSNDESKKELSKMIWILTRWMSSTKSNSEHHTMIVNDVVNVNASILKSHPELQWMLLALCGVGRNQLHQWVAPPKGIRHNKKEEAILNSMPLLKKSDLELLLSINSDDDFRSYFKGQGMTDKEINDLLS